MKKHIWFLTVITVLAVLCTCACTALADEAKTYIDPVHEEKYVLSFKAGTYSHYLKGERLDEGQFEVDEEKQTIKFTCSKTGEIETLRFVDDTIYGGKLWKWFRYAYSLDFSTYGIPGIEVLSAESADAEKLRLSGPYIALINGKLYSSGTLFNDESLERSEEESLTQWMERIEADGSKHVIGWYDESLLNSNMILCMFTDEYLHNEDRGEAEDMILGLWTDDYAYNQVFLNAASDLYKTADSAYHAIRDKDPLTPVITPIPTELPVASDWREKLQIAWDAINLPRKAADHVVRHIQYDSLDRFMLDDYEEEWQKYRWLPGRGDFYVFDNEYIVVMDEQRKVTRTYHVTDEEVDYDAMSIDAALNELYLRMFFSGIQLGQLFIGEENYAQQLNTWHAFTQEQLLKIK